ncbi:MAG: Asp-tRNA(Asn)/Glu-tRNA(Gln) amidotransferase subunit GatB [Patescibacteria group bacterium]
MDKKYQVIIGMEVHAELKTHSKMFCGCKNDPFHAEKPNIYTCPACLGLPGALPVANKKAIEWTVMLGLALGCKINKFSKFDRKHYFYPDLPKGYQISQYDLPFCYDGKVKTSFGPVGITRVHLEEDTGKLIHQKVDGRNVSLIDFNRSSVPLIEIVTEPEIYSSAQAKEYAKKLRQIIRYLDISDCDMEKGGMRLEANISLQKKGETELPNYKVELKNINSFRFLERGIEYEIKRQKEILEAGKTPDQETRGYNSEKNITYTQRSKENAADYRYFPDPDLPPIRFDDKWFGEIKSSVPEPLDSVFNRWEKDYKIDKKLTELLFETAGESKKFDKVFSGLSDQKLPVDKFVNAIVNKKLSVDIFGEKVEEIINTYKKSVQVDDVTDEDLKKIITKIIKLNPKAVEDLKVGKTQSINFLVGQVMCEAKKKIEFNRLVKLIQELIK